MQCNLNYMYTTKKQFIKKNICTVTESIIHHVLSAISKFSVDFYHIYLVFVINTLFIILDFV